MQDDLRDGLGGSAFCVDGEISNRICLLPRCEQGLDALERVRSGQQGPLLGAGVALCAVGAAALERSGGIGRGLAAGRSLLIGPIVLTTVTAVLVAERRWPAEARPLASRGPIQDGAYFVLHVVAVVPFMTLLSAAFAQLLAEAVPRWTPASGAGAPMWLLVPATFVLMDGCNWLAHRADHRFGALWRFHALHHSQEELSVLTSFRAHPVSHLPGFMLAAVPPFVLLGPRSAPLLVSLYVCLGTVPHANLPWSYGPVGRLLVSPAYHRLHHAADRGTDVNFGIVLTAWDVLSGRARWPGPSRAEPTGLAGRPVAVEQAVDRWDPGLLVRQLVDPLVDP